MRDKDIINTLKHVEAKRQELLNLMFDARMEDKTLENVSHLVADILNNLTKCFDYCANDIYDKYIASKVQTKKSKPKVYFPFYENQLQDKRKALNLLFTYKKIVYDTLLELTKKLDSQDLIENTEIPYSIAREVRDLVNMDKHDKIMEVDNEGPSEILAKSQMGTIVVKVSSPGFTIVPFPNQEKITKVSKSYRLVENNKEVADFCSFAQWNTEQILDILYRKFFGVKIKQ